MSEFNTEKTGFTLDGRVMCTDDTCIGIVGTDGLCKECGLAYAGDEKPDETPSDDAPAPVLQDDEPANSRDSAAADDEKPSPTPGERVCCLDETCIGIIGADGKCGTCGKPG